MIVKQLKILSQALWESIKTDTDFFSPVQSFAMQLAEKQYTNMSDVDEGLICIEAIERFFKKYKRTPESSALYLAPRLIVLNEETLEQIIQLLQQLKVLPPEELSKELKGADIKKTAPVPDTGVIFIGHGKSKLWARVQVYLQGELGLQVLTYESESRVSQSIINVLKGFLEDASFAILIMTAEDETAEGTIRARQNVIHEVGLFQGKLGFDNVIILMQDTVDPFTNIAGLQYIPFAGDAIEQTFFELQKKLKALNLLK